MVKRKYFLIHGTETFMYLEMANKQYFTYCRICRKLGEANFLILGLRRKIGNNIVEHEIFIHPHCLIKLILEDLE